MAGGAPRGIYGDDRSVRRISPPDMGAWYISFLPMLQVNTHSLNSVFVGRVQYDPPG